MYRGKIQNAWKMIKDAQKKTLTNSNKCECKNPPHVSLLDECLKES